MRVAMEPRSWRTRVRGRGDVLALSVCRSRPPAFSANAATGGLARHSSLNGGAESTRHVFLSRSLPDRLVDEGTGRREHAGELGVLANRVEVLVGLDLVVAETAPQCVGQHPNRVGFVCRFLGGKQ